MIPMDVQHLEEWEIKQVPRERSRETIARDVDPLQFGQAPEELMVEMVKMIAGERKDLAD